MSADLTVLTSRTLGGLRIEPVDEVSDNINMLIYGYSGVGKTVLAGSASEVPEMCPILIGDVEGGTMSLKATYPDVDVVRIGNWRDFQKLYIALAKGEGGYRTVVLDSLSEMQKLSMRDIMKELLNEKPESDPDIPGLKQWAKNTEQVRRFVRAFRDLPMNVIFTALAADHRVGTEGNSTIKKVSLSDKLSSEVAGFVDVVLYMYIKVMGGNIERLLLSQATSDTTAKDRTGRLERVIKQPTMSILYNQIHPTTNPDGEQDG